MLPDRRSRRPSQKENQGGIVKILKSAALLAAVLIASVGCGKHAEDTSADEAVIRASAPAFADAYNAGDVDKLVAMYWEDAVLLPPGAPSQTGSAEIRAYFVTDTAAIRAADLKFNIPEAGAVDVAGDLAYESGTFSVTDAAGSTVATGKYIGVFQKRDGKWLYIRDTWNTDAPPPAAPVEEPAAEVPAT